MTPYAERGAPGSLFTDKDTTRRTQDQQNGTHTQQHSNQHGVLSFCRSWYQFRDEHDKKSPLRFRLLGGTGNALFKTSLSRLSDDLERPRRPVPSLQTVPEMECSPGSSKNEKFFLVIEFLEYRQKKIPVRPFFRRTGIFHSRSLKNRDTQFPESLFSSLAGGGGVSFGFSGCGLRSVFSRVSAWARTSLLG